MDWNGRRAGVDLVMSDTFGGDNKNSDAAAGFNANSLAIDVKTDAPQEKINTLLKLTERYCVVFQTLNVKPELSANLARA